MPKRSSAQLSSWEAIIARATAYWQDPTDPSILIGRRNSDVPHCMEEGIQPLSRWIVAVCLLLAAVALAFLVILHPRLFLSFLSSYQSSSSIVAQRTSITILIFGMSIAGLMFASGLTLFRHAIRP